MGQHTVRRLRSQLAIACRGSLMALTKTCPHACTRRHTRLHPFICCLRPRVCKRRGDRAGVLAWSQALDWPHHTRAQRRAGSPHPPQDAAAVRVLRDTEFKWKICAILRPPNLQVILLCAGKLGLLQLGLPSAVHWQRQQEPAGTGNTGCMVAKIRLKGAEQSDRRRGMRSGRA